MALHDWLKPRRDPLAGLWLAASAVSNLISDAIEDLAGRLASRWRRRR